MQIIVANNSGGISPAGELSIYEPVTNSLLLEIQSSSDVSLTDPWLTIASKNAGGAWSGTATFSLSSLYHGRVTVKVIDTQIHKKRPRQFYRAKISSP